MVEKKKKAKKVILIIRDGWGYSRKKDGNIIKKTETPWTDKIEKKYPTFLLEASGEKVGLPVGFAGNSAVGHATIGAGRRLTQFLLRINNSIQDKTFFKNKTILKLIQNVKKNKSTLHLISILQKEGVHGDINHLESILEFARNEGLKKDKVVIHLFTDGRDAHPENAVNYLAELAEIIYDKKVGIVATICGRYFGMDRNNNLERTEKAYQAIFNAQGNKFDCGLKELEKNYKKGITDEFIEPLIKNGYQGIKENDSLFFINFRKDRSEQLTKMILNEKGFLRTNFPQKILFASMVKYYPEQKNEVVFKNIIPEDTLGDILEKNDKKQLRISETEKFAHVTFFFDGGTKKNHQNRKDILIPSPQVATYDLQPEMSAEELTQRVCQEIEKDNFDFIVLNFPNADMVGHTGNKKAASKAVETVDKACQKITELALKKEYVVILTADHGNIEEMIGKNITSHSVNPVPTTIISNNIYSLPSSVKNNCSLQNIAPTILKIMKLERPTKMVESML